MTSAQVPDGVGRTALGMARIRADEDRRTERLFSDPYARLFLAAAPGALPEQTEVPGRGDPMAGMLHSAVIRTRFYDDFLVSACAQGCRQVVLVAAGLDSRAFRLPWPDGVHVFELDLPTVLAFKDRVLTEAGAVPRGRRSTIGVDLRQDWSPLVVQAGFSAGEPAVWLVEGLLVYLAADEAAGLLDRIGGLSAPGSRLACEYQDAHAAPGQDTSRMPRMATFSSMWKGGLGPDTPEWLTARGWRVRLTERDVVAESYGRPGPEPSRGGFITAERRL
jgi:methyltransferase (TIGR00027 family)